MSPNATPSATASTKRFCSVCESCSQQHVAYAQSERSAHDDVRSSDIGCETCDASHSTAANGITSTVIPIRAVLQEEHVHALTLKMRACVLHTFQQMCAVS